jgi:hypothetical protein
MVHVSAAVQRNPLWRTRHALLLRAERGRGLASVDRKSAFCKSPLTKTTLDLPDELMREVKIRAVHEQKKLRVMIVELLQKRITATEARRGKIPKPAKLRGGFIPSTEDIEAAINWGRD